MATRRPFVGGNWKMNTTAREADALARAVTAPAADDIDIAVFPPFVYLDRVSAALRQAGSPTIVGAQDLDHRDNGALTGQVSAAMLTDLGCTAALTGHSERRHILGDSDDLVGLKTARALGSGLICLLCIGETLEQREAGDTDAVNERQLRAGLAHAKPASLDALVVAYEPVWAIGTGRTASPEDAQNAHAAIRGVLADLTDNRTAQATRILYGGSVKPSNAAELFAQPDIDGGLIGGASLDPEAFAAICQAATHTTSTTSSAR
ncbi:MAG: triose-phosphate isomerase [Phycisphaeraceae bacterium]|nr:triose-phosphate isomerase [Phycisphaeraceae bacterium]MCB9848876.1 triose-phosphate isomerase [Phycisphaeraceae bacterium]